jgi:hypothetical protein
VAKCQEGDAAIDWVGFRATIIERRRDAASAGSVFWPYGIKAQVEPKGNAILVTKQASGSTKIDPLMAALDASR